MATALTAQLTTQYEGDGVNQFVDGVKQADTALQGVGSTVESNTGPKLEGLLKRIERPIGMIAFVGIANDLTNMGNKGESAGIMIEQGLRSAGMAMMYFNPLLGMAVIGGTALFEVFEKINAAKTSEEFQKEADAIEKEYEAENKLIPLLLTKKSITADKETAERLKQELAAMKMNNEEFKKHYEDQEKNLTYLKEQQKLYAQSIGETAKETDVYLGLEKIIKETENDITGSRSRYINLNTEIVKKTEDEWQVKTRLLQADMALADQDKERMEYQSIDKAKLQELLDFEKEKASLEILLSKETDNAKKKELQDHITYVQTEMELERKQLSDEKQINQQRKNEAKAFGQEYLSESRTFLSDFVKGNKDMLNQDLSNWVNSYAEKLFAAATADAFVDPVKAGGELAGALALESIANSLGGSGSSAASAASQTAVSSSSSSPTQQTNVNIQFTGGSLSDPGAIAIIMKGINKSVLQNNGQIVTTTVSGSGPAPPGMVT